MKKLFVFAIAAGMFFVACNGGSTPSADSTAAPIDTMNAEPTPAPADSSANLQAPVSGDSTAAAPGADSTAAAK